MTPMMEMVLVQVETNIQTPKPEVVCRQWADNQERRRAMKTTFKIIIFLILLMIGVGLLFKLLGFVVWIAAVAGMIALIAGLLYVLFGSNVNSQPNQLESRTTLDAKSVQTELHRRQREIENQRRNHQ
jgi:predicted nucleic acid-binding Zn ribbon protein